MSRSRRMADCTLCTSGVSLHNQETFYSWQSSVWWFYLVRLMSLQLQFTVVLKARHKSCNQFDDAMIAVCTGGGGNVRHSGSQDSRASYFCYSHPIRDSDPSSPPLCLYCHSLSVPPLPPPTQFPSFIVADIQTHTCACTRCTLFPSHTFTSLAPRPMCVCICVCVFVCVCRR